LAFVKSTSFSFGPSLFDLEQIQKFYSRQKAQKPQHCVYFVLFAPLCGYSSIETARIASTECSGFVPVTKVRVLTARVRVPDRS
jgi:hypothetical protein